MRALRPGGVALRDRPLAGLVADRKTSTGMAALGLVLALAPPLLCQQIGVPPGTQPVPTQAATQPTASRPFQGPSARDWPMWGRTPARNAVLPTAAAGPGLPAEWNVTTKQHVKWSARLGSNSYGGPVTANGKVYGGTNNAAEYRPEIKGDKGCLLCFDAATGKFLWQATHDKLASGPANDWPEEGVASSPCVDGDRVYYVSNRCELVCADVDSFRDGKNDGPYKDEKYTTEQDADFIWILDMIGALGVFPHNLAACSPVVAPPGTSASAGGDLVFVCTGNGVDEDHERPPHSEAPSFIAVNKKTGEVVWKRNDPGGRIFHGQWSSPAYGIVAGVPQVIFGGGDGWCYAFDPPTGNPLWKFNLNPPGSKWEAGGAGTASSIVATPVITGDRVYLAVGDDPENQRAPGHLYAINATKRGDVTEPGRIWHFGAPLSSEPAPPGTGHDFGRTLSSVVVADGLVYAADLDGFLYCLDEKAGQRLWKYDLQAAVWGTPLVADGKVFLGNADGDMVVLQHSRELKELARNDMKAAIFTTAAVADGVLYIVTQKALYAIAR